jgi:hypothetical protein
VPAKPVQQGIGAKALSARPANRAKWRYDLCTTRTSLDGTTSVVSPPSAQAAAPPRTHATASNLSVFLLLSDSLHGLCALFSP